MGRLSGPAGPKVNEGRAGSPGVAWTRRDLPVAARLGSMENGKGLQRLIPAKNTVSFWFFR